MRSRKRDNLKLILVFLLLSVSLGYAFIKTDLTINGTSKINATNWNVYFDNVQITAGSVTLSEGDSIPTINSTTLTDITYVITLKEPGDFYEFTVDVVNDGTLDAMIGTITNKLNNVDITTLPTYMNYSVTYSDGGTIQQNHLLAASTTETYKVRIEYRTDIDPSDLPSIQQTNVFNFGISYIQADDNATSIPHVSSLYSVLEKAATVGTYARKYTGEHKDSFTSTGTEDIYYWYSDSTESTNAILDKNNVVFAGYCWKMYRTTDTGGIKMVYNGRAINNQCSTKANFVRYAGITEVNYTSYSYYYGDSYTFDENTGLFQLSGNLENTALNATTASNLIGKYSCQSTSSSATCSELLLFLHPNTNKMLAISLSKTQSASDNIGIGIYHYTPVITNNGNTTRTVSPASVGYMYHTTYSDLYKRLDTTTYKYAQGFTYNNGTYTLNSDSVSFSGNNDSDLESLNTHHYTCWNTTGECNTISYIYSYSNNMIYSINLNDGKSITDALDEMLYEESVNTHSSIAKLLVEGWYKNHLNSYDNYIEDVIYCNNRNIQSLGGWGVSGSLSNPLVFKGEEDNLSCERTTDQFSTFNNSAKLNYKVGLLTADESKLLNDITLRQNINSGWLITPKEYTTIGFMHNGYNDYNTMGVFYDSPMNYETTCNIRPTISLKPNTMYTAGDGSLANPYLVETS